ncbi:hypothetical protein JM93_03878 [Roseibium hamelinense]|uniref:(S)-ureidoglycine aminohydrolase cupin domain-containing protein n=1 Tax=Roseibium hamelinense TaxID=150831 RepID=A0A562SKT8_9HYPH|nr:cupin domain-containing protein [Roseibium hamelinense]MTI43454.1 DUF861 domain-containing protein [Roseibium hamelinense]TWI81915.1 hypothetical protein JM93_03878 [Roseibium hamelinense]
MNTNTDRTSEKHSEDDRTNVSAGLHKLHASAAHAEMGAVFPIGALDRGALLPAPINPNWILEGSPDAYCANMTGANRGWTSTDHWSCTAGKFRWHYGCDEAVMFLEGEAFITDAAGVRYHARPGICLFFPVGTSAVWEVPEYVRKIAFNQRALPKHLVFLARVQNRLKRMIGLDKTVGTGFGT